MNLTRMKREDAARISQAFPSLVAATLFAFAGTLSFAGSARAEMPGCTVDALKKVAPAGLKIGDIPNMGQNQRNAPHTVNGVAYVPAMGGNPEYCVMTGTIETNPATHKTINFSAGLPAKQAWNGKYMQQGCGYNCGNVGVPDVAVIRKGYVTWATDDGHTNKRSPGPELSDATDASWATVAPGKSNTDAVTDFMYRAVHTLTVSGKAFTQGFYGANKIERAYFVGCSDGGREGMVEASRFPADYDGIIAGAPYFDMSNEMMVTLVGIAAQLRNPGAALTLSHFQVLDEVVRARCDESDGTKDGLIQNPASCSFDPYKDLPRCKPGDDTSKCFTPDQIDSVNIIYSAITDPSGKVVYPGWSVSDANADLSRWLGFRGPPSNLTGPQPWSAHPELQPQGWYWANNTLTHVVYDNAPGYNSLKTPGITFVKDSVHGLHAVIPDATVAHITNKTRAGSGATPSAIANYLAQGRKLIMYHGFSDGLITPYRTIQYYKALAGQHGGYDQLRKNAELFLVPDMGHCGGGPGVTSFSSRGGVILPNQDSEHDILAALEGWVEHGKQPAHLIASKFSGDGVRGQNADPAASTEGKVIRTMPLCPFPAMAKYSGKGDINDASNWSCPAGDTGLEKVASDGVRAGEDARLSNE